mgnify:CR=1 FL=1
MKDHSQFLRFAMPNMHNDNWDDLRFVLAVAEAGTVSGAARVLGVNHATVLRRIAAFEERHGAPVFQRTQQGYVIRPDMLQVIEAAQEAGAAMRGAERGAMLIGFPLMFVNASIGPHIVRLHRSGETDQLARAARYSARMAALR